MQSIDALDPLALNLEPELPNKVVLKFLGLQATVPCVQEASALLLAGYMVVSRTDSRYV